MKETKYANRSYHPVTAIKVHTIALPWGGYLRVTGPRHQIKKIRQAMDFIAIAWDPEAPRVVAIPKGCRVLKK